MNRNRKPLTDEQMSSLLACAAGAEAVDRAEDAELNHLREALSSYRTETFAWAERRSASQPSLVAAAQRADRWAAAPRWALAGVAAITLAVGLVHYNYSSAPIGETTVAVTQPVTVGAHTHTGSSETIDADNRLLQSIDAELSYHPASPVDEYGMQSTLEPAGKRSAVTEVRD